MKQCEEESELRIPIKNKEIVNVRGTNFLGAITESNMSWETHTEGTYGKIISNLFIIN
jgi:hypothetical protein